MKRFLMSLCRSIAVLGLLAMAPLSSRADLTFFTTAASFNAAAPGLPVENFGAANLSGQSYVTQPNGLSGATNDGVFALNSILPGITISTVNPGDPSKALEVEGGGTPGGNSVGTDYFQDTLVLTFAPGVFAVGENVFGNVYPGPSFAGQVSEVVYHGSTRLGSTNLSEAAGAGGFIGVTSSTSTITSITLFFNPTADVDSNTYITNVAFTPPTTVPEPRSLALMAIASACLGFRLRFRAGAGRRGRL